MAVEINGKIFNEGDTISINGRKGIVWKFYKADGVVSVAVKYDNAVYEMYLVDNVVVDD